MLRASVGGGTAGAEPREWGSGRRAEAPSLLRTFSPVHIRRLVGAWAATQPATDRPDDAAIRRATDVAFALYDTARELAAAAAVPVWDVSIPVDLPLLAEETGLEPEQVRGGLRLLEGAAVLAGYTFGVSVVRLHPDTLTATGDAARLDAAAVRRHLPGRQAAAALRVLRAIALAPEEPGGGGWRRLAHRQIADALGVPVDRVEYLVRRLRDRSLLEGQGEPRKPMRYRLTALAFGGLIEVPAAQPPPTAAAARVLPLAGAERRPGAPAAASTLSNVGSQGSGGAGEARASPSADAPTAEREAADAAGSGLDRRRVPGAAALPLPEARDPGAPRPPDDLRRSPQQSASITTDERHGASGTAERPSGGRTHADPERNATTGVGSAARAVGAAGAAGAAEERVLEFDGSRITLAPGVPLHFEMGADGEVWCRIGARFRIGPG